MVFNPSKEKEMEKEKNKCAMCGTEERDDLHLVHHLFKSGTREYLCPVCLRGFKQLNPEFKAIAMPEK